MITSKRMKTEAPHISTWAELPDEIMMEVLLRLPVKSILRFRAVCRAWAATLSSGEFRALHVARAEADGASSSSSAQPPIRLLVIAPTSGFCDATAVYSWSPPEPSASLLLTLDDVRGDFVDGIAAPCRGLVLLFDAVAPAYYVVNAATRAVTRLPPPSQDVADFSAGLGYDAQANKHKVMRLLRIDDYITCEVYTLGGVHGDRWTLAAGRVPPSLSADAQCAIYAAQQGNLPPVFANGSLHWLVYGRYSLENSAVAAITFSVTEETFGWVQAPPCGTSLGVQLVELGGCLCMVRDLRRGSPSPPADCIIHCNCCPDLHRHGSPPLADRESAVEIWKLHDYTSGVWSLDTRVDLSHAGVNLLEPKVIRVLGATGGDGSSSRSSAKKIVVMATSNHTVHAYDTMSKNVETILSGISYPSDRTAIRVCLFNKETFAHVHKTQQEVYFASPVAKATKEILLRLPPRSVVQFKLVCSQWRRLIEDKGFIHSYYSAHKNGMENRAAKIMIVGKGACGRNFFRFAPLENWLLSDASDKDAWLDSKVVCSKPCHGLNLLITAEMDYLYNPCTGYCRTIAYPGSLPRSPWETPPADGGILQQDHAFATGNKNVGLGFNPFNQEHVSVIMLYQHKDFKSREYHLTCSVWHCRAGFFQEGFVPWLPVNNMPPAYVDGMLFWMSDPRLGPISEYAILYFDIATKEFGVLSCPSEINTANWSIHSTWNLFVAELRGKLCVVLADLKRDELMIWEFQNGEWDEIYTVRLEASPEYSLRSNVVAPLAIDPMDGNILLSTGRKMGLYDPVNETVGELYDADEILRTCKMTGAYSQGAPCQEQAMPLVPMLYEGSIVCYPRKRKYKILR